MLKTPAEQCRDEGREEGRAEGRAEGEAKGRRDVLLKLLQLKFGSLPEPILDTIARTDVARLDQAIERVMVAASLNDVFADD